MPVTAPPEPTTQDVWDDFVRNLHADHETRLLAVEAVAQNTRSGAGAEAYTLALPDAGRAVEQDFVATNTVTVPANASVAFPIGTVIEIYQVGGGLTTIAPATGVTIQRAVGLTGSASLSGQYASASLRKRATDVWALGGDLA